MRPRWNIANVRSTRRGGHPTTPTIFDKFSAPVDCRRSNQIGFLCVRNYVVRKTYNKKNKNLKGPLDRGFERGRHFFPGQFSRQHRPTDDGFYSGFRRSGDTPVSECTKARSKTFFYLRFYATIKPDMYSFVPCT